MSAVQYISCGASSLLFGDRGLFAVCEELDRGEQSDSSVYLPWSKEECGDSVAAVEATTFLHAVPRSARLSLWARLEDRPEVCEYVTQIHLMGLGGRVDPEVRFIRVGNVAYPIRGFVPGALSLLELYYDVRANVVGRCVLALPTLASVCPDGYCYLSSTVGGPATVLAAILGPYPQYSEARAFIHPLARATVQNGIAHIAPDGAGLLLDLAEPNLKLGGPVCWNQEHTPDLSVCESCLDTTPPVGEEEVCEGLIRTGEDPRGILSRLCTANLPDIDVVCDIGRGSSNQNVEYCDEDRYDFSSVQSGRVRLTSKYWLLWLDRGEVLFDDRFEFAPRTFGGGLMLGRGDLEFGYRGSRYKLLWRALSSKAYVRYLHMLRLGVGSCATNRVANARPLGGSWLFLPGSAACKDPKLWCVGRHPVDSVSRPPRRVAGSSGEVYCHLTGDSCCELDVGLSPILLESRGPCVLGEGALLLAPGQLCVVWSPVPLQLEVQIPKGLGAVVFIRSCDQRCVAGRGIGSDGAPPLWSG